MTSTPDLVVSYVRGHVGFLTLNRTAKRNAVNLDMARAIADVMTDFESDANVLVIVISANGPAFCAGQDLQALANGEPEAFIVGQGWAGLTARTAATPVIAAIEGPAFGGGFEIALACDMVVASMGASFALPEVRKMSSSLRHVSLRGLYEGLR
ncbi:enoyl-CoA hydratase/carnithine racemase [Nocardioides massiliensis]|uniref:Enoyl-CoA hydratase/carnithine racemase n=2 Tax=Nocardioides massiliensis TaxID=1325935 RepID=A0ABT9NTE1_9ACTN|nr:enoyl-CoA hydratase-related protein [Nocardioides massiliensis]MDP9823690.1 enoyl-CoA hydratase/carnithine racemase [Nocardioides massiliensis]